MQTFTRVAVCPPGHMLAARSGAGEPRSPSALERARRATARSRPSIEGRDDEDDDDELNPDAWPAARLAVAKVAISGQKKVAELPTANVSGIEEDPFGFYGPAFYHQQPSLRSRCIKHSQLITRLCIFIGVSCTFAVIMLLVESPVEYALKAQQAEEWDSAQAARLAQAEGIRAAISDDATAEASLTALLTRLAEKEGLRPVVEIRDWTFVGSLYFVFTVSTAIGYGSFVPMTDLGRGVTIMICIIGISSFIGVLASVARIYSYYFRRTVGWVMESCIDWKACLRGLPAEQRVLYVVLGKASVSFILGMGVIFGFGGVFLVLVSIEGEQWTYFECIYFAMVTLTTVGFGDRTLQWYGQWAGLEVSMFVIFTIIGLAAIQELLHCWVIAFSELVAAFQRAFGKERQPEAQISVGRRTSQPGHWSKHTTRKPTPFRSPSSSSDRSVHLGALQFQSASPSVAATAEELKRELQRVRTEANERERRLLEAIESKVLRLPPPESSAQGSTADSESARGSSGRRRRTTRGSQREEARKKTNLPHSGSSPGFSNNGCSGNNGICSASQLAQVELAHVGAREASDAIPASPEPLQNEAASPQQAPQSIMSIPVVPAPNVRVLYKPPAAAPEDLLEDVIMYY